MVVRMIGYTKLSVTAGGRIVIQSLVLPNFRIDAHLLPCECFKIQLTVAVCPCG